MRGTVVFAEERQARNGGTYNRIGAKADDGRTYFFNTRGPLPEKGQYIEIPEKAVTGEGKPQSGTHSTGASNTAEDRMNRSVALKAAAQVFSGWAGNGSSVKAVLELAEEFLQWLQQ